LLTAMGTQEFGANNPGTGTTPSDGLNWYRLTSSFQTYYTGTASSPYGSNNIQLQARVTDVSNNSTGTAAYGEIRVVWTDGYVDQSTTAVGRPFAPNPAEYLPHDLVDGTLTLTCNVKYATGIMVPNNAVFTVATPTIGVGSISADYTAFVTPTYTPSLFFDGLVSYLNAFRTEFRNPSFYNYRLDGFNTVSHFYDQLIVDGLSDMFDQGNWTMPVYSGFVTNYINPGLASTPINSTDYARCIRYELGKTLQTVDSNFTYKTFGYTDPDINVNETVFPSKGGPESRPLTVFGYRPGSGVTTGIGKIGGLGADGSGAISSDLILNGADSNGFTVYAYFRTVSAAFDASVCDLYLIIGHPRWNSVYGTLSYGQALADTNIQNAYISMSSSTNLICGTMLLSKASGVAVTTAEALTIISALTSRMKNYFNF